MRGGDRCRRGGQGCRDVIAVEVSLTLDACIGRSVNLGNVAGGGSVNLGGDHCGSRERYMMHGQCTQPYMDEAVR